MSGCVRPSKTQKEGRYGPLDFIQQFPPPVGDSCYGCCYGFDDSPHPPAGSTTWAVAARVCGAQASSPFMPLRCIRFKLTCALRNGLMLSSAMA
jgi:hypothetical protein